MLVEGIREGGVERQRLGFAELHFLLEVEVGLEVCRRALRVRLAYGNGAGIWIPADIHPLAAVHDIRRERAREGVAYVEVAGQRSSAVGRLEDAGRRGHPLQPTEGIRAIALDRAGTVGGQQAAGRAAHRVPREVGLVERTAVVGSVAPAAAIGNVGAGETGVVAAELRVGVAEHTE